MSVEDGAVDSGGWALQCKDLVVDLKGRRLPALRWWKRGSPNVNSSMESRGMVLDGASLEVAPGTIYGLLGPSGCGKTTLIGCCLGSIRPTSGSVSVLGGRPGSLMSGVPGNRVGYMPQDYCLEDGFTCLEILTFFGKLHQVQNGKGTRRELAEHCLELLKLLELEEFANVLVRNLSGGQKRRVSLACSIVHDPPLLLLDEPTVGLDPTLRETIWSLLVEWSRTRGKTVLITTHYIGEAARATKVGFMLGGKVVAQGCPLELIRTHKAKGGLEEVFLNICSDLDGGSDDDGHDDGPGNADAHEMMPLNHIRGDEEGPFPTRPSNYGLEANGTSRWRSWPRQEVGRQTWGSTVAALLYKNFRAFARNRVMLIFLSLLPVMSYVCFLLAIGGTPTNLGLGFVNLDSDCSTFGTDGLNISCPSLWELLAAGGGGPRERAFRRQLPCYIVSKICQSEFIQDLPHIRASMEEGLEAVKSGNDKGFVVFGKGFTSKLMSRLAQIATGDTGDPLSDEDELVDHDDEDGGASPAPELLIRLDASNFVIRQSLAGEIFSGLNGAFEDLILHRCRHLLDDFSAANGQGAALSPEALLAHLSWSLNVINVTRVVGDVDSGPLDRNRTSHLNLPGIMIFVLHFLAVALTSDTLANSRQLGLIDRELACGTTWGQMIAAQLLAQSLFIVVAQDVTSAGFLYVLFLISPVAPEAHVHLGAFGLFDRVVAVLLLMVLHSLCGMTLGILLSLAFSRRDHVVQAGIAITNITLAICGLLWPLEGMPGWIGTLSGLLPLAPSIRAATDLMLRNTVSVERCLAGFIAPLAWTLLFLIASGTLIKFKYK